MITLNMEVGWRVDIHTIFVIMRDSRRFCWCSCGDSCSNTVRCAKLAAVLTDHFEGLLEISYRGAVEVEFWELSVKEYQQSVVVVKWGPLEGMEMRSYDYSDWPRSLELGVQVSYAVGSLKPATYILWRFRFWFVNAEQPFAKGNSS